MERIENENEMNGEIVCFYSGAISILSKIENLISSNNTIREIEDYIESQHQKIEQKLYNFF